LQKVIFKKSNLKKISFAMLKKLKQAYFAQQKHLLKIKHCFFVFRKPLCFVEPEQAQHVSLRSHVPLAG
jgi:hypothetical protein